MQAHPALFPNSATARRYCGNICFPRSGRWVYQLNGKSGNSSTLALLFELEFGVPFGVKMVSPTNQHPDFALFELCRAGVFGNPLLQGLSLADFDALPGLRIATVRNPFTRAVSSFLYLCRSQKLGDVRFVLERLRLQAIVGFDWAQHDGTPEGFLRFLDYIRLLQTQGTPDMIDAHWLPQVQHIQPAVYRPDLIGRTEDMAGFVAALADRLGQTAPQRLAARNRTPARPDLFARFYADPAAADLVRRIYAADFETFGYDPQDVKPA